MKILVARTGQKTSRTDMTSRPKNLFANPKNVFINRIKAVNFTKTTFVNILMLCMITTFTIILTFQLFGGTSEVVKIGNVSLTAENNDQRIAFINHFGYEVSPEASTIKEIVIPEVFTQVYENYNELQKEQGFNLAGYKGKKVTQYVYEVLNYPNYDGKVNANLIVFNNKIIAADICSTALNGFMEPINEKNN